MRVLIIGCTALAGLAALVYFLTGAGILQPGNLTPEEAPAAMGYASGIGYLIGGFLILLRKRWVWIIGGILNMMVIAMFFKLYSQRPDVLLSLPGVMTKSAQIVLEVGLISLIITHKPKTRNTY